MNATDTISSSPATAGGAISLPGLIVSCAVVVFVFFDALLLIWCRSRIPSNTKRTETAIRTRLEQLQRTAPKQSFETWWKAFKTELHLSEEVDSQFVCAICIEPVHRTETIHALRCHHIFHDGCLEQWFLNGHFTCPLCHAIFFREGRPPKRDVVADVV